ncbi:MAG: phosphoribosylglycinamide formyltransferase [Betaproteobacteria bacterium]
MKRLVILISGRGSNMAALIDAVRAGGINATIAIVISNRPAAAGLGIAAAAGIATSVIDHRAFADRLEFERALSAAIDAQSPDLIVLAGFMRILSPAFVARYAGRLLNIHPSLLPAYPGVDTHRRALADGVRIHGCTVHFVTADVDHGPIVAQGAVAVQDGDDEATLAARVLAVEHRLLVGAVRWFCADRVSVDGGHVRIQGERADTAALLAPSDVANSPPR